VKLHRNVKTTPHMRALVVDRIQVRHWAVGAAAAASQAHVRSSKSRPRHPQTNGARPSASFRRCCASGPALSRTPTRGAAGGP
jgi:hypothetical protein